MSLRLDSQGRAYFAGDNITITASDLEWIRSAKPRPAAEMHSAPSRIMSLVRREQEERR